MPKKKRKEIDPKSFEKEVKGIYDLPKKIPVEFKEEIEEALKEKTPEDSEPTPTNPKQNKQEYKEPKKERNQRVETLLISLIGVIIILGIFIVWSVSSGKFKTDISCPSCNCPEAQLTCQACPSCNCNQTCPKINDSAIINAINNVSLCVNGTS